MNRFLLILPLIALRVHLTAAEPPPPAALTLSLNGIGSSSVSPGTAAYAASLSSLELHHRHVQLGLKVFQFDWSGTLPGQTADTPPWEHLTELSLGTSRDGTLSDTLTYHWTLGALAGFERETRRSLTPLAFGYLRYSLRPGLTLLGGAFASRHPEVRSDYDTIPLLALHWQPQSLPALDLRLGLPRTQLRWALCPHNALRLELSSMEGGIYRLEDNTPLPDARYVEFSGATLGLHLDRPLGPLDLSIGVLLPLEREFTLRDPGGRSLQTYDVERRPAFALSLTYTF